MEKWLLTSGAYWTETSNIEGVFDFKKDAIKALRAIGCTYCKDQELYLHKKNQIWYKFERVSYNELM